jgi:hypothetical protein
MFHTISRILWWHKTVTVNMCLHACGGTYVIYSLKDEKQNWEY